MQRLGLPSNHSSWKWEGGEHGKPHLPLCWPPMSFQSHAPGWGEEVDGDPPRATVLSPAHCVPFINIDAFLSPAEIWLPGLIITLVVRILAHELALLLGTVSHSFQVVPGVEASLCRGREAIFQVSSSLSSSLSKHQLPRRPGNVREKSPCQIPRISLSHYVTLHKVTYVLRALVSLI